MTAVPGLDRLEQEFADSLICQPCWDRVRERRPAYALAVFRTVCAYGSPLPPHPDGGYFVCHEHADALQHFQIVGAETFCLGCGFDVTGQMWSHVIDRVEPIGLPR